MPKKAKAAVRLADAGSFQMRYNAIPNKMYNTVHTGPKIQLGGLKDGLFILAYQISMLLAVA